MSSNKRAERIKNSLIRMEENQQAPSFVSNNSGLMKIQNDQGVRVLNINDLVDAPSEWNFYEPFSEEKLYELVESIIRNGLLHPIVVWEQKDGKFMILAGHNRVRAYKLIYELSQNEDFLNIVATVKGKDQITEIEAREIIIDTNWVARELSVYERMMSVTEKFITLGTKYELKKGEELRDVVAKDLSEKKGVTISGRQVSKLHKLINLIPDFIYLLRKKKLSIDNGNVIADYDFEVQQWIYDTFNDKLKHKYLKYLKTGMNREEIEEIFEEEESGLINVKVKLPKELKDEFKTMVDGWLSAKGLDTQFTS